MSGSCSLPDARQEALAELGEISSRMAHEIRNPLNAIRMQVAVIRNKLLQPDPQNLQIARGQLDRLEQEVLRVDKLARSFLEFGRPPADEPEEICLADLLHDVASLVRPEFEERGHLLETVIEQGAASLVVHMDRAKLRQVILNILANARKAMSTPGRVQIRLASAGRELLQFSVEDTGCGIPADVMPHIFVPFYSRSFGGEGLGLAIVKKIVESAGGQVDVTSAAGHGTCFKVQLPAMPAR
jgi:signal transduction histidine kinase